MNTFEIAEYVVVPEAQDSVSLGFDDACSIGVRLGRVLASVDLDDELCSVAGKIREEMTDWRLLAKMRFWKRRSK